MLSALDYSKYKHHYIDVIHAFFQNQNQETIADHKIYEMLWALEKEMILWDDIPPGFEDIYKLPHRNDMGVDLLSLNCQESAQVKLYSDSSWICPRKLGTYVIRSLNLNIERKNFNLLTTPEAKIHSEIELLFQSYPERIQRMSLNQLVDKHILSQPILHFEEDEDEEQYDLKIEQRPYLLAAVQSILQNQKEIIKVQWTCGLGKTYLAFSLYLALRDKNILKEDEIILFVTPWRTLGRQVLKECKELKIPPCLLGDGEEKFDKKAKFVIVIKKSLQKIPKSVNIRMKFGDEGHHFEDKTKSESKLFYSVPAQQTILLSATFYQQNDIDYLISKREAIDQGYITDYKTILNFFEGNRQDALLKMIVENKDWLPVLIYFNDTEKTRQFCELLQRHNVSADFLTGDDKEEKRNQVKKDIDNGVISVVCLCGVWNEGESIKRAKSVIFGDLRFAPINVRQVSQRGSRKHESKPYYNIVLPIQKSVLKYNLESNEEEFEEEFEEEYENYDKIIKIFAEEDVKFRKAIESRSYTRIGIRLNNKSDTEENKEGEGNEDESATLLDNVVFNSLNEIIHDSRKGKWKQTHNLYRQYIDENQKRPTETSDDKKIKYLAFWGSNQSSNYKKKKDIMKDEEIYKIWERFITDDQYKKHFDKKEEWKQTHNLYRQYIDENQKKPSKQSKDEETKYLAIWGSHQVINFKKKVYIMAEKEIYEIWERFIKDDRYKKYFPDNKEEWKQTFTLYRQYIDENDKRPSTRSDDKETKYLGKWGSHQVENYKKKQKIMKDKEIYQIWERFITDNKYKKYFS